MIGDTAPWRAVLRIGPLTPRQLSSAVRAPRTLHPYTLCGSDRLNLGSEAHDQLSPEVSEPLDAGRTTVDTGPRSCHRTLLNDHGACTSIGTGRLLAP